MNSKKGEDQALEEKRSRADSKDIIIVGIGASAGGLDALRKLLPGLPADVGMAFVIVQHLAPKYHSTLPALLAKYSVMPVDSISDGMHIKPNRIYITPPNKNVILHNDRLILKDEPTIGPKPSIDTFFKSLAEEKKTRAMGIILSGTGKDGAHGLRAIKSNEGITMAQTADSAKFDGMPKAAVQTGIVDLVLRPEKIGEGLQSALNYPHLILSLPAEEHQDEIGAIIDQIHQKTGIDYREYKTSTIHRRISRRMAIHQLGNSGDYLTFIKDHPEELVALSKDMLISVTGFFRDSGAFEVLARNLKKLFETKKPGDTFRAWVPGCSTGEEAYSIALLLAEMLGEDMCHYRFQLFATDIDGDTVQMARKGIYPVAAMADMDQRLVEKYFTYQDHTVAIKKQIRDMVVLARQDLIKDTNFMHLDLISCRNLLIYINADLQEKLLSLFHFSLNPDGLLFLGKSESVGKRDDLFRTIDSKWRLYQRRESPMKGLPELMKGRQISQVTSDQMLIPRKKTDSCTLQEGAFIDSLMGIMDCCAVLTDENANIHYIRGDVSAYLKLPEGHVKDNLNAVEMARPKVRSSLQWMIHKVIKTREAITSNPINLDNDRQGVLIKIGPAGHGNLAGYQLIVFTPVETSQPVEVPEDSIEDANRERMRELEQELAFTREYLQSTTEELETSNEELQSLNEELQAANEELQATNEELETSNEELQSSNEELNTVNDELRAKSDEANELLDNLTDSEQRYRRLVDNMNEALMLCEIEYGPGKQPTDLVIRQANNALAELMSIRSRDLPIRAGAAKLQELVSEDMLERFDAISGGANPQRFEVHLDALDKDLTLSVYNMGNDRLGVVCRDDTERRRAEAEIELIAEQRQLALDAARMGWWHYDPVTRIASWDERFREIFGITGYSRPNDEILSRIHPDDYPGVRARVEAALDPVEPTPYSAEFRINLPDGSMKWIEAYGLAVFAGIGENRRASDLVGTVADITERKRTTEDLAASEKKYRELIETANSIIIRWDSRGVIRFINEYGQRFFGYSAAELLDHDVMTIVPKVEKSSGRDLDALVKDIVVHPDQHAYVPSENLTKDGRTVWVAWTNKATFDEAGNVREILAIGNDITALKETEERLNSSLDEKKVLLKEIHHRVKNNLQVIASLISLQIDVMEDPATRDIFQDISHRVRSMAIVHEKLYQADDLAKLEFADYTQSLLNYLWNSHSTEAVGVKLITNLEPIYLTVNKAVPCGLILNELISNALKHAFNGRESGHVAVTLKKDGQNGIWLSVKDNGIGLPPHIDLRHASSLGLRLIEMLAKQLHAELNVSIDNGTEFSIAFKGKDP